MRILLDVVAFGEEVGRVLSDGRIVGRGCLVAETTVRRIASNLGLN